MRCTQNPTTGEEWRRGWHPERIGSKGSDAKVLIVGAGPAGIEAARGLGQRGYAVTLAEARTELGGRVTQESALPGLGAWGRVRDWRVGRIQEMTNVEVYLDSSLTADQVLDFGFDHVLIATGATWRKDGVGINNARPIALSDSAQVYGPEDVFDGKEIPNPVVVFDDDNFYLGGLIAEKVRGDGRDVTLVTTESVVSAWTTHTMEQHRIQSHLMEMDVSVIASHNLARIDAGEVEITCLYTKRRRTIPAAAVVMVTSRTPNNGLYLELTRNEDRLKAAGSQGSARFTIIDASITETKLKMDSGITGALTKQQAFRYDATVEGSVEVMDSRGFRKGFASARARRSRTVREDATLNERDRIWFALVEDLMQDFNAEIEKNIRQHLSGQLM